MNRIKELPKSSAHLLSSTQIITSIHSVVKELVENALDSSSKSIEIKLQEYGLEKIEVKDNGSGIHKDDICFVAKPHCTSKITCHLDLSTVETYGFRGEALAALCAVSDLVITTKSAGDEFGFEYTFDHNGNVLSSKPCPVNQGTSVTVSNLFKNVPVRRQFYRSDKIKKEELKKIEDILISFGCVLNEVRFTLHHNRNFIWQKSSVNHTIEGLQQIFGTSIIDYFDNSDYKDDETQLSIVAYLPRLTAPLTCSLTTTSRSIIAVNKRPVRMKVFDKLLKEYFSKTLNGSKSRYPICFISITIPQADVDVNYEPNKTAVLVHNTDLIISQLSNILRKCYYSDKNLETASSSVSGVPSSLVENGCGNISKTTDVCQEWKQNSEIPSLHLKQSKLFPELPKCTNLPDVPVVKSKLSRKNEFKTPSSKKVKTSSTFLSPTNDIIRHIDTMKSFFSSNEQAKAPTGDLEDGTTSNESPNHFIATVTRDDHESLKELGNTNDAVDQNILVNSLEISKRMEQLPHSCEKAVEHDGINNLILTNHNSDTDQQDANKFLREINVNSSIISPVMPVTKEICNSFQIESNKNPILEITNNSAQTMELPPVHTNENSSITNHLATVNEWSRGLHPIEKYIQPVAVLNPKVVQNDQKLKGCSIDMKISDDSTPNARKITPFDIFCRKHRLEVASLNPDYNNHQLAQILSERWSRLSAEEKAIYKNLVSKDYPKDIKNKEKLGKVISQNLNKEKSSNSPAISKKSKQKLKLKRIEKNIAFNLEMFTNSSTLNANYENNRNRDDLKVINCLTPGIWICSKERRLYLLNSFRLHETIIYERLLETYEFEAEPLESSFILSANSLGDEAMDVILRMDVTKGYGDECLISDERLVSNGFKIRILKGDGEMQIEVIGMTKSMAFYGVSDLKEILSQIQEKGKFVKLSDCRSGKAVLYLQSEAVRIARQIPASRRIQDVEDLLEKRKSLASAICLHSKPFLHELCTICPEEDL